MARGAVGRRAAAVGRCAGVRRGGARALLREGGRGARAVWRCGALEIGEARAGRVAVRRLTLEECGEDLAEH
eukprot:4358485-Prymnesium_polylepis.1